VLIFAAASQQTDSNHSDANSDIAESSPQLRAGAALETLKTQHEALVKSLHALSYIDAGSAPPARMSPLPSTAEEEEVDYRHSHALQSGGRFSAPFTRKSRTSIATTFSDGTTSREWFDAFDGGEEFVLEMDEPTPEEKSEVQAQLVVEGSRSSLGGSSDTEEGAGEEVEDTVTTGLRDGNGAVVTVDPIEKAQPAVRRTELPCGPVGDEGSLFAVLKKNVGKVRSLQYLIGNDC